MTLTSPYRGAPHIRAWDLRVTDTALEKRYVSCRKRKHGKLGIRVCNIKNRDLKRTRNFFQTRIHMTVAGIYEKGSVPVIMGVFSIGNNDGRFVKVLQRGTLPCEIEAMRTSFYHDPGVVVSWRAPHFRTGPQRDGNSSLGVSYGELFVFLCHL